MHKVYLVIICFIYISNPTEAQSIDTFPYSEGWESGFGDWTQSTDDQRDWSRTNTTTETDFTGPSSANEGSYYIYFEGTVSSLDAAILESPVFDFSHYSNPTLTFDYHMYFNFYTDGTLQIDVSTNDGSSWTNLWSKTGQQGTNWFNDESVSLSSYSGNSSVKLRIKFTRGNDFFGYYDAAVDDINIGGGSPLPVELISFTAFQNENGILLNWETATEVNNYGFEVERTNLRGLEEKDDINLEGYTSIGFVQGHGNSNSPKTYEFIDENPPAGNLEYRLKQIDTDGSFTYYSTNASVNAITRVEYPSADGLPEEFSLSQNYPNPFNPTTTIKYTIPSFHIGTVHDLSKNILLKVYDILGNEIATLVNEQQKPGNYSVTLNANNLATGLYIYKLSASGPSAGSGQSFVETKKMILLR